MHAHRPHAQNLDNDTRDCALLIKPAGICAKRNSTRQLMVVAWTPYLVCYAAWLGMDALLEAVNCTVATQAGAETSQGCKKDPSAGEASCQKSPEREV